MSTKFNLRGVVASAMLLAMAAFPAAAAEERKAEALSAWEGAGQFIQTGEKQALFVGSFQGILFITDMQGSLDAGKLTCPAMLELDLEKGSQKGEGRCVVTNPEGDKVFAKWNCEGVHLAGCIGEFNITGGTGKLKGITGKSQFLARSAISVLAKQAGSDTVEEAAAGILMLKDLTYKIP